MFLIDGGRPHGSPKAKRPLEKNLRFFPTGKKFLQRFKIKTLP